MPQTFDNNQDAKLANPVPHAQLSRMIEQGRSFSGKERNCVYLNTGNDGLFTDVSFSSGLDFEDDGRSVASVDWDHDGDLDLFISNRNAPRLRFLKNNYKDPSQSLLINLKGNGDSCNTDAIGARVEIEVNGKKIIKSSRAGEGFLTQSSKFIHFGLQDAKGSINATVRWPNKNASIEIFRGLSTGNRYTLQQGTGETLLIQKRPPVPDFTHSKIKKTTKTRAARVPIVPLMSGTELKINGIEGEVLATGNGKPTLVFIWASWCGACIQKINEITKRSEDIRKAGLQIIALNVDQISQKSDKSKDSIKMLKDMNFPFANAIANEELLSSLQENHNIHVGLSKPLPIPAAFLMDSKGRTSVIYKGSHSIDTILKDIGHSELKRADRFVKSSALDGITIQHPNAIKTGDLQAASLQFRRAAGEETKGNLKGAEDHYLWATELVPEYTVAQLRLAKLYIRTRQWKKSAERIELAMRYNTISNDEQFLLAKTYLQLGENNKAFNTLSVIHKKSPTFAPAIFELAAQYAKKGNNYESVNYYRKGLKVEPNNIKALNNLAWLLATSPDNNVKDASQALSIAKKIAIDTNHKNPDTLDTLAAAFAANGQFINAVQTLEKAIAILNSNGKKSLSENYKIRLNSYKSKISNQK